MFIKKVFSSVLVILCLFCVSVLAQPAAVDEKAAPAAVPYKPGEVLEYEGKYSKLIFRGIDIATLNFRVEPAPDEGNFVVRAVAKSEGGIIKLINLNFHQSIESTVDGENLRVLRTAKRDEQDDRVRVSEALFDYEEKKVSYVESDPHNTASAPRVVASPVRPRTQDIISAIYMLRYVPLVVGDTFEMTVSDAGLVYRVPVRVTGREERRSILGKKMCFRVEPVVFGKNRLVEKEGKLIIWITDDADRIPIRAHIYTSIGKVVVKLKRIGAIPDPEQTAK